MQEALAKLEQEIKTTKRACRLSKSVLEEGLDVQAEAQELHAKFSALAEALAHLNQALDTHYASLEDDTQLEQILISLKRVKSKTATPLASLESASSAKEVLEALASLEQGVLDLEGVLTGLKAHPSLNAPTSPKATPKAMAKKYCPQSKEELKALVADESVHLGEIDIGGLTDLSEVFQHSHRESYEGLETWDVSQVTNMEKMLDSCRNFNQPLNHWDVSKVTNMRGMFLGCDNFNQPLNDWNVSRVTNMEKMFFGCKAFNQPLNSWDVSNVRTMGSMFAHSFSFSQPLDNWNVSSTTNTEYMFFGKNSLTRLPIWYRA
ncbi:BspA family leucine-rich repeat surface protein [Helicobacter mehlei]|uniref:BspA family leucine-rich repeat surface protein n=1 Tax=Helicobacter mehlei TaxID=2316080 RepID=A0A553V293_9HELI|nr:BspA family leucine-rich repeat surface protein [Helicobacter mehlei]TSA86603.1 BspA family leucine-rich repeat surface protein [Helicobacter mehlei]